MKSVLSGISAFLIFSSCYVASTAPIAPAKLLAAVPSAKQPDFREEFLSRLNKLRAKGCNCGGKFQEPAPPLTWNTELELAALAHAQDMNRNKYFDHKSKNGDKLKDRLFAQGYTYEGFKNYFIGENIALGQRTIKEVMDGWIASEHHCENLMNPRFKEVGIAVVNSYWVQDFGARNPFDEKSSKRK